METTHATVKEKFSNELLQNNWKLVLEKLYQRPFCSFEINTRGSLTLFEHPSYSVGLILQEYATSTLSDITIIGKWKSMISNMEYQQFDTIIKNSFNNAGISDTIPNLFQVNNQQECKLEYNVIRSFRLNHVNDLIITLSKYGTFLPWSKETVEFRSLLTYDEKDKVKQLHNEIDKQEFELLYLQQRLDYIKNSKPRYITIQ